VSLQYYRPHRDPRERPEGGGPGGAFVPLTEVTTGSPVPFAVGKPLLHLGADDVDATLAAVEAHGGKTLVPKTEIPHVGWWAVFADPTGNPIALFSRNAQESPEQETQVSQES